MMNSIDIFPSAFSKKVSSLRRYPEFEDWIGNKDVKAFISYANTRGQVKFLQKAITKKHLLTLGRECKYFNRKAYYKRKIDFLRCAKRLSKNPHQAEKTSLGFKFKNVYLVKAYFTFGLRRVQAGSAHVIQTSRVPVMIYICPKSMMFRNVETVFPKRDLKFYTSKLLSPMGKYRIPPLTEYVLLTIQKTLFRLDVVPEELPLNYQDPTHEPDDELRNLLCVELFKPDFEIPMVYQDPDDDLLLVEPFKPDFEIPMEYLMDLENLKDLDELFTYIENPV